MTQVKKEERAQTGPRKGAHLALTMQTIRAELQDLQGAQAKRRHFMSKGGAKIKVKDWARAPEIQGRRKHILKR